ncbi:hypothetical protein RKE29_02560 [Streptomyces sp. B1866]|uniref:hypothetical protein n=1 Tax=Streptomyces sp. B1866 TaxID=3075431 RepID=UPI00288F77D4|nr:hypothetical protein [Streptomyces sp. B1866]MDT3395540.1 hypothetical protein [Streptomyces sp. B1866]
MSIGPVLRDLHRDEEALARHLLAVAERHRADHEVHHLARDLAAWSRRHARALTDAGSRYGVTDWDDGGHHDGSHHDGGESGGGHGTDGDGLALLRDLRKVCADASAVSVDWVLLGQAAQATHDAALLALVQDCHPETLRQIRWAGAVLKESGPQILAG